MTKRFGALILSMILLFNKSYVYAGTPIRFGVYQNSPLITFHPIEVRYASVKGANETILATIDTHWLALKADQDSACFYSLNTWFGANETREMPDWVLWVLAISISFLVFMLISSYYLRLRVRARTFNLEAEISAHKRTEAVLQEKTTQQESMMETAHSLMESLDIIQSNIQKATHIVNNLLSFTHIKSVDRIPVQVSVLLPSVLAQNPAPDNVTVDVDNCIHLPSVYIGYSHIEQVLGNLLTNAYQAMPDGGHVTLYCEMSSEHSDTPMVAVSVQDTGTGITSENKGKIFEPLFTTKRSGIGLGLAISKRLIEANEGWIDFFSKGVPGKGSRFTIWLPLESEST